MIGDFYYEDEPGKIVASYDGSGIDDIYSKAYDDYGPEANCMHMHIRKDVLKIQLSGPIKDNPDFRRNFEIEATVCRQKYNCEVWNPADLDPDNELLPERKLLICLEAITDNHKIKLMENWWVSAGVFAEIAFANAINVYRPKNKHVKFILPNGTEVEPYEVIAVYLSKYLPNKRKEL